MVSKRSKKQTEPPESGSEAEKEPSGIEPQSQAGEKGSQGLAADLELEKDVAELRAIAGERDRVFERLQRVTAELENYRKRVQREREQWRRYALEGFLKDLLGVVDNFDRARQAARESGDLTALLEGLELVDRELRELLSRYGVAPIEALGLPFDPFEHEAVEVEPASEGAARGTVTAVLQTGYRLYDRVLRPARVRVAEPPEAETPASEDEGTGSEPRQNSGAELDIA